MMHRLKTIALGAAGAVALLGVVPSLARAQEARSQEVRVLQAAAMYVRANIEGSIVLDGRRACSASEECAAGHRGLHWEERGSHVIGLLARALGSARTDKWENALYCEAGQRCRIRDADHVVAFGAVEIDGNEARVRVYRATKLAPGSTLLETEHYERDVTLVLEEGRDGVWTVVREEMVRVT